MINYDSDHKRNKQNGNAIVYKGKQDKGEDEFIKITLQEFLDSDPRLTESDFLYWKRISDEGYLLQEKLEEEQPPMTGIDFADKMGRIRTSSLEDQLIEKVDHSEEAAHEEFLKKREMLKLLQGQALDRLTDAQRRRFLLHWGKGLPKLRIAEIEGVSHQSICKSIEAAEKVKEIFRNTLKTPCTFHGC
jgi:hypothetical protein